MSPREHPQRAPESAPEEGFRPYCVSMSHPTCSDINDLAQIQRSCAVSAGPGQGGAETAGAGAKATDGVRESESVRLTHGSSQKKNHLPESISGNADWLGDPRDMAWEWHRLTRSNMPDPVADLVESVPHIWTLLGWFGWAFAVGLMVAVVLGLL